MFPCASPWDMCRLPCPSPWSCVGRHVSGPGQPQHSTLVPQSLWAGMCRGRGARGGSKEGRQTSLPPPWGAGPKEGFSGGVSAVPCPGPCPSSGGDEQRATRKRELLLPPAGIARRCRWPRSLPGPTKPPGVVSPRTETAFLPAGLVRGLLREWEPAACLAPVLHPPNRLTGTARTPGTRGTLPGPRRGGIAGLPRNARGIAGTGQ